MAEQDSERVVREYGDMVWRICVQRLHRYGRDAAEDAFQNVFLYWLKAPPRFADAEHARRWFARCALDRCRDYARRAKRRDFDELPDLPVDDTAGEISMDLIAAITSLPEKYAAAVMLVHGEGMSGEAAAKVLGITHAALRKRLSRAMAMLRERLGEDYCEI